MASLIYLLAGLLPAGPGGTASPPAAESEPVRYTLRYRYQPGETVRWKVTHRSRTQTTIAEKTQAAETFSESVKVWRILDVEPDGTVKFEHLVENVQMRQQMGDNEALRYDSRTDQEAPLGFQQVAAAVGVPLAVVTMDDRGHIRQRRPTKAAGGRQQQGEMTIRLPEESVAIGESWSFPGELTVRLGSGGFKRVKVRHSYRLRDVRTGVATIEVETQIITPIHDPRVELQLLKHATTGTVRFDVEAGRVLSQQMDLDRRVVGFHTDASVVHYQTRLTERLLSTHLTTASRTSSPAP